MITEPFIKGSFTKRQQIWVSRVTSMSSVKFSCRVLGDKDLQDRHLSQPHLAKCVPP